MRHRGRMSAVIILFSVIMFYISTGGIIPPRTIRMQKLKTSNCESRWCPSWLLRHAERLDEQTGKAGGGVLHKKAETSALRAVRGSAKMHDSIEADLYVFAAGQDA